MPQLDLSTLSGAQLRQLLDSARSRGQATLAYQILQEMAARREGREAGRRLDEPRVVALDLGDPLERRDEPEETPSTAQPFPDDEPALTMDPMAGHGRRQPRRRKAAPPSAPPAAEPSDVWDDDIPPPEPDPEDLPLQLSSTEPARPPPPPYKPRRRMGAGFVVGIAAGAVAGVVLGWGLGETAHDALAPAVAAGPVQAAALAPAPPAPVSMVVAEAAPAPAPATQLEPANGLPLAETGEAMPPADVPEIATETAEAPAPERPKAETVKTATAVGGEACAAEPTSADRTICSDPDLRRLQRELRQAYADALEAHEDRALLRERQLAWRDARNEVSEPDRLARLYEARIRKLRAAAAAARQGQSPD